MNNRAVTLSLLMSILAIFFMQSYVSSIEEQTKKKFGTEVLVVVAKKDILEMATMDETMVELKPIPKRFVEPTAISFANENPEKLTTNLKSMAGLVARVPIKTGEQITDNKITEPGMRTGLSPQITPGKRAVAVPVSDVTGVSKLVKPGDRVDIIASLRLDGAQGKKNLLTRTLIQDVIVLSVGRSVTNNVARYFESLPSKKEPVARSLVEDSRFATVTLEVTPGQAQELSLIMAMGSGGGNQLFLALRNTDDTERPNTPSATLGSVFGVGESEREPASTGRRE